MSFGQLRLVDLKPEQQSKVRCLQAHDLHAWQLVDGNHSWLGLYRMTRWASYGCLSLKSMSLTIRCNHSGLSALQIRWRWHVA